MWGSRSDTAQRNVQYVELSSSVCLQSVVFCFGAAYFVIVVVNLVLIRAHYVYWILFNLLCLISCTCSKEHVIFGAHTGHHGNKLP